MKDWTVIDADNPGTWPPENVKVLVSIPLREPLLAIRYRAYWLFREGWGRTWYKISTTGAWMPAPVYDPNEEVC